MALPRRAPPQEQEVRAIIHLVHSYRFLTIGQLRRLLPGLSVATLNLLVRTRHLAVLRRPTVHARIP